MSKDKELRSVQNMVRNIEQSDWKRIYVSEYGRSLTVVYETLLFILFFE